VDVWASWSSCTSGVLPKVGCSDSSVMVGRFWVDDWWRGGLLVGSHSGPSPGFKRWLSLLGGIV
jgi:hypothetical protein